MVSRRSHHPSGLGAQLPLAISAVGGKKFEGARHPLPRGREADGAMVSLTPKDVCTIKIGDV